MAIQYKKEEDFSGWYTDVRRLCPPPFSFVLMRWADPPGPHQGSDARVLRHLWVLHSPARILQHLGDHSG